MQIQRGSEQPLMVPSTPDIQERVQSHSLSLKLPEYSVRASNILTTHCDSSVRQRIGLQSDLTTLMSGERSEISQTTNIEALLLMASAAKPERPLFDPLRAIFHWREDTGASAAVGDQNGSAANTAATRMAITLAIL